MEGKQQAFQKLKPLCVSLSQLVVALNESKGSIAELTSKLEDLQRLILSYPASNNPLDEKLADYVFFPLSQVLKLSKAVSIRCLELTLSILTVLVSQGWRQRIQPQLATQILILCTLLASDKPSGLASTETTVELRTHALQCLGSTFKALGASNDGRKLWRDESNMPQLGQSLSTILDALVQGLDLPIQLAATGALKAFVVSIDAKDTLAGFLPGSVSKLTRVLVPQTSQRRNHQVLVECLQTLRHLLTATVSDDAVTQSTSSETSLPGCSASVVNSSWVEEAATQLKPAIANILRLRDHERDDVRLAISHFCFMLLTECQKSLANCTNVALETFVILAAGESDMEFSLELDTLIRSNFKLASLLQEILHEWLQSSPRIMQSADEQAKTHTIQRIRTAYETLVRCHVEMTSIGSSLESSMRDSILITMQATKIFQPAAVSSIETVQTLEVGLLKGTTGKTEFGSALVQRHSQKRIMKEIEAFVEVIGRSSPSSAFLADVSRNFRSSQGDALLANFWLLYVAARSATRGADDLDSLLNMGIGPDLPHQDLVEEMYDSSLRILDGASQYELDNRLKSLALRVLTLRAERAGQEFRYELVDALYPVLHTLATPDSQVQQDGIIALNRITEACGYGSTQELIVANVDYLTNAVALKLNAFDVSPQAPQVLLMMVQLAGPSLLPFLEDTIESIFAALEDFHGYPLLVELLFRVLVVMAEEGVKAPQLAVTNGQSSDHKLLVANDCLGTSMGDLLSDIRTRQKDQEDVAEIVAGSGRKPGGFPQRPWGATEDGLEDDPADSDAEDSQGGHEDEEAQPPAAKTFGLLLKITTLTQHFLPSASPTLRMSLLGLIRTTSPAIAQHENSFLPLVNTLWPEVTARLQDSEPNVQITALEIVIVFCEHAKDFMRSRVLQLWPLLQEIYQSVTKDIIQAVAPRTEQQQRRPTPGTQAAATKAISGLKQAITRMKATPADYSNTLTRMLWDAIIRTITAVVQHIPLPPENFDDALALLGPCLNDETIRRALEAQNADAVWLMTMRSGLSARTDMPTVNGDRTWRWAVLAG